MYFRLLYYYYRYDHCQGAESNSKYCANSNKIRHKINRRFHMIKPNSQLMNRLFKYLHAYVIRKQNKNITKRKLKSTGQLHAERDNG